MELSKPFFPGMLHLIIMSERKKVREREKKGYHVSTFIDIWFDIREAHATLPKLAFQTLNCFGLI